LAAGVNVATTPEYVTVPATAAPLGPVTVKVVALIVVGPIGSLKVALSTWLTGTLTAPFTGIVDTTVGGGGGVTVENVHT
jgi:ATP-dependent protease Clp ATPase subunit